MGLSLKGAQCAEAALPKKALEIDSDGLPGPLSDTSDPGAVAGPRIQGNAWVLLSIRVCVNALPCFLSSARGI